MAKMEKRLNLIRQNSFTKEEVAEKEVKYQCSICQDREYIIDRHSVKPCRCRETKIYQRILQKSGISEAFQRKTFKNYDTNKKPLIIINAKKMAMEYVAAFQKISQQKNNSIAFFGQVGAAKTHLSIAIANELMRRNIGVLYMQYREIITHLKQCIIDEEYYQREISKYKTCSVLMIDDLFKGLLKKNKVNDTDINIMFEIINYRYLKGLPVIVSSEYAVDKLLEFDEAVGSRIIEMSRGKIVEFEGIELNHRLVI
ncbi:ATP-binding protein [Clostridium formicaceticum]|nr:DnaA/Hda family protein [Clostridium formicaceticum]